jgi:hypothetical protein
MSDQPEFDLKVTGPEIEAAIKRGDYEWLVENVFTPALGRPSPNRGQSGDDRRFLPRNCSPHASL